MYESTVVGKWDYIVRVEQNMYGSKIHRIPRFRIQVASNPRQFLLNHEPIVCQAASLRRNPFETFLIICILIECRRPI